MDDHWILSVVRTKSRRRVLLRTFVLLVFVVLLVEKRHYFLSGLSGPFQAGGVDTQSLPTFLALVALMLAVFQFVRTGLPAWRHFREPTSHPAIRRLHAWEEPALLEALRREIGWTRYRGQNGWSITQHFLVQSTFFTFNLLRLSDLVWAYKVVTRRRINFIIPAGTTYDAVFVCYGAVAAISDVEQRVDQMLSFAAEHVPWAWFGFTEDRQARLRNEMSSFCAEAEHRRRRWLLDHPDAGFAGDAHLTQILELTPEQAARGVQRRVEGGGGAIMEVAVPAGVDDGVILRLIGRGMPARSAGRVAGNLYLVIRITPAAR